ncbi:DNA gyrase inhibitor YacG [Psychrobacter sp. FDAARGOS_221]|uniref:DNA gyrase inhibitor YacG n=1 Tax=Psychrobacter sp. FDAARGOS_221 TaxID=1975705 RepID=UPI000BB55194|nr:DNA gyrase inhibitor YacG [Psychrobacter sp. FDAARGOS_221]PNK59741.1 DNA gyrase inhibitor YacG [Psychrobacter sp. FDAARGOS_221]
MSKANISADTDEQSTTPQTPKTYPCPQCRKPTSWQNNPYKPFCSDRCKLIDLGAWANEEYRVPAQDDPFSTDLH